MSEIHNTLTNKKTTTYTTINQKLKSSVLTTGLDRARKTLALERIREPLNLQVGQNCGLAQYGLSSQIEANLEKVLVALSPQAPN